MVLVRRGLLVRYRHAALGFAWIIIQPLVLTLIVSVFLGLIMGRGDRYGLPFPVFLFIAWTAWRVFQRIMTDGGSSILQNGSLIQRIYLPRVYFVLAIAIETFVDYVALVAALLVMLFVFDVSPGIGLLTLPILVAIVYAAGLGVAFFFAAAGLKYKDMFFVVPLVAQAWFWMSPIIYTSEVVPEQWRNFYYLNPLVVVIEGMRWGFAQTPMPPLEAWLIGGASATVMLVLGYVYFRQRESIFADLL
jgi:lipopolysaccharide transport system permease protein